LNEIKLNNFLYNSWKNKVSTNTASTTITILPSSIAPTLESTTESEITTVQPKTTEETTVLTIGRNKILYNFILIKF
jgi:hypothetical protein